MKIFNEQKFKEGFAERFFKGFWILYLIAVITFLAFSIFKCTPSP